MVSAMHSRHKKKDLLLKLADHFLISLLLDYDVILAPKRFLDFLLEKLKQHGSYRILQHLLPRTI